MTPQSIDLAEWETRAPVPGSVLAGASLAGHPTARALAHQLTEANKIEVLELAAGLEQLIGAHGSHIEA